MTRPLSIVSALGYRRRKEVRNATRCDMCANTFAHAPMKPSYGKYMIIGNICSPSCVGIAIKNNRTDLVTESEYAPTPIHRPGRAGSPLVLTTRRHRARK